MANEPRTGESWATRLVCSRTGATAPLDAPAFVSPAGAPWLVDYRLDTTRGELFRRALAGRPWTLWRYRELLPLNDFEARAGQQRRHPFAECDRLLVERQRQQLAVAPQRRRAGGDLCL